MNENSDLDTAIGQRIRAARENAGMSVADLAIRTGVEAASVAAWEEGERAPRANRLRTLSGILNVSLAWLLQGDEAGHVMTDVIHDDALQQRLERVRLLLSEGLALLESTQQDFAAHNKD